MSSQAATCNSALNPSKEEEERTPRSGSETIDFTKNKRAGGARETS